MNRLLIFIASAVPGFVAGWVMRKRQLDAQIVTEYLKRKEKERGTQRADSARQGESQ